MLILLICELRIFANEMRNINATHCEKLTKYSIHLQTITIVNIFIPGIIPIYLQSSIFHSGNIFGSQPKKWYYKSDNCDEEKNRIQN